MKAQPASWVTFSETTPTTIEEVVVGRTPTPIPVAYMDPLPSGCLTADRLLNLSRTLNKLEAWYRRHGKHEVPCLRLVQGARNGRVSALVQVGEVTLRLALRGDDWVVLGDALKVSD